jgi:hypothetical protein
MTYLPAWNRRGITDNHGMERSARRMWTLFEPIHAVVYFTPDPRQVFEAAGLRGFWRGYFAGRAAPLGPVDAAPVVAAFANFAPGMVARALPDVWQRASPEQALRARQAGSVQSLSRLLPPGTDAADLTAAADLMEEAVAAADCTGRVLAAANAALPRPEQPLARVWQAATTLREHRGDGHVAALVTFGLDACEVLAWRCGLDLSREVLQPARGWTDDEWAAAQARLAERGWLDTAGRATEAGRRALRDIEEVTDRAAEGPWQALGAAGTARLDALLAPLARACRAATPAANPIGLPAPD